MTLPGPVVLASGSPRRKELLASLGIEFTVDVSHVDEDALTVDDPWETATGLARAKALAVAARYPKAIVIGGDTVVALPTENGYRQLAKPTSPQDAEAMLKSLSGARHAVITGLALVFHDHQLVAHDTTWVEFRTLEQAEITRYVQTGEPMDKAGAYAIQAGAKSFVAHREGSLTNVIGLPLELLQKMIDKLTQTQ
jgi:septum formation protein